MKLWIYVAIAAAILALGVAGGFQMGEASGAKQASAAKDKLLDERDRTIKQLNDDAKRVDAAHKEEAEKAKKRDDDARELLKGLTDASAVLAAQVDGYKKIVEQEKTRDPELARLLATPFPAAFRQRMRDNAAGVPGSAHH